MGKLVFQTFPGSSSSIDAHTKRGAHARIDRNDGAPLGMERLYKVVYYTDPASYYNLRIGVPECDILLSRAPDGILQAEWAGRPDFALVVVHADDAART